MNTKLNSMNMFDENSTMQEEIKSSTTQKLNPDRVNREYKDTVFRDLFSIKKNTLSLYKALSGDQDTTVDDISEITLTDVLFKKLRNDLAFKVHNKKIIVLAEHQSTLCENMPLRMLVYVGREYEKLLEGESIHKNSLIKIDWPIFVVLYNGVANTKEPMFTMDLANAYAESYGEPLLNLKVKFFNINYLDKIPGLNTCTELYQYMEFIKTVRRYNDAGYSLNDAMKKAIKECIENGVLVEYLQNRGSEVVNMLSTEWKLEEALDVRGKEEREKGEKEGAERINKLNTLLMEEHRFEDLKRSITDRDYQKELLEEFGL